MVWSDGGGDDLEVGQRLSESLALFHVTGGVFYGCPRSTKATGSCECGRGTRRWEGHRRKCEEKGRAAILLLTDTQSSSIKTLHGNGKSLWNKEHTAC